MMSKSILYNNADHSVILFDIPTSIREGQQSAQSLTSSVALQHPFPSSEPRGVKREIALAATSSGDVLYHRSIQKSVASALAEVQAGISAEVGGWCQPRHVLVRKDEPDALPIASGSFTGGAYGTDLNSALEVPVILSSTEARNHLPYTRIERHRALVLYNPRQLTSYASIEDTDGFMIPSKSVSIQATLQTGRPAFDIATQILFETSIDKSFDLILMDPPWMNRSVRRSGTYATAELQVSDPFTQAVDLVGAHLSPAGWVAIWVTNKSTVRESVRQRMQMLHLHLHEEWIWIKTTSNGEPVTPLDGVWRRPYEMLLLFREDQCLHDHVRRRVIAAVPDVHSRKPCLKRLFERLLPLPAKYNALELFARSLTAGWWSWGDEVLKFQHESCWVSSDQTSQTDT